LEWVWVHRIDGFQYDDAIVLEVLGNKMAPRYPEKSRYVIRIIQQEAWPYSSGVHLIALKNKMVMLRRIVNNSGSSIHLVSDVGAERIDILLTDVDYMWKLGECTFIPPED
jgi:phage repressor protein C with HTH and peptisase S24 domain